MHLFKARERTMTKRERDGHRKRATLDAKRQKETDRQAAYLIGRPRDSPKDGRQKTIARQMVDQQTGEKEMIVGQTIDRHMTGTSHSSGWPKRRNGWEVLIFERNMLCCVLV